jgi:hypothetical protein
MLYIPFFHIAEFDFSSSFVFHIHKEHCGRHQWLTPVILATQEAEIRKNVILSWPQQTVCEALF